MKHLNLLWALIPASLLLSCSSDSPSSNEDYVSGEFSLVLNSYGNSRADERPIVSSEAGSAVDKVRVFLYKDNNDASQLFTTYCYNGSTKYTTNEISWSANTPNTSANETTNQLTITLKGLPKNQSFTLIAYGFKDHGTYNNTFYAPDYLTDHWFGDAYGIEPIQETFAGSATFSTDANGNLSAPVTLIMRRKVAAVMGYFKNIPEKIDGTAVKSIKVYASGFASIVEGMGKRYDLLLENDGSIADSEFVNSLGTTSGANILFSIDVPTTGEDWSIQNGIYTRAAYNLTTNGTTAALDANSVIGGAFVVPFNAVTGSPTLKVALCDASESNLKTWTVVIKNTDGSLSENSCFPIAVNNFYSIGTKTKAIENNTVPTDDEPIDFSATNNNVMYITLNNAWAVLNQLGVTED